jgi:predicted alpha/beta-hydrolase family hydrolase
VDDLVVDGHAYGGRVALVAQEDRYHLALIELLADDLVQLPLHEAGPQPLHEGLQHLRDDASGIPHDGDLVPRLEDDGHDGYRTS